jgi:ABC-type sugar transport system substrate-binding protein
VQQHAAGQPDLDGPVLRQRHDGAGAIQALRQAGKSGQVRVTAFDKSKRLNWRCVKACSMPPSISIPS